jgi:hypothetical protein
MIGQGGAAKTINGVDIWQIGTPPRKFQIIGFIEDSRPEVLLLWLKGTEHWGQSRRLMAATEC